MANCELPITTSRAFLSPTLRLQEKPSESGPRVSAFGSKVILFPLGKLGIEKLRSEVLSRSTVSGMVLDLSAIDAVRAIGKNVAERSKPLVIGLAPKSATIGIVGPAPITWPMPLASITTLFPTAIFQDWKSSSSFGSVDGSISAKAPPAASRYFPIQAVSCG